MVSVVSTTLVSRLRVYQGLSETLDVNTYRNCILFSKKIDMSEAMKDPWSLWFVSRTFSHYAWSLTWEVRNNS